MKSQALNPLYAITSVPQVTARPSTLLAWWRRPLGYRKPIALRPRRLDGGGRKPYSVGSRAADHGRTPQRRDRLPSLPRRIEHCRSTPSQRDPGSPALTLARYCETMIGPVAGLTANALRRMVCTHAEL